MNRRHWLSTGITATLVIAGLFGGSPLKADQPVSAAFAILDHNRDGALELNEWLSRFGEDTRSVRRREFYLLDADENGQLNDAEFRASSKGKTLTPGNAFRFHDLNADEVLTPEEYLATASVSEAGLPAVTRNFRVLDFDESGGLSLVEFRSWPGLTSPRQRGTIPDPILDLFNRAQEQLLALQMTADGDQDGQLSAAEWATISFPAELSIFQEVPFARWDADENGLVSRREIEQLLAVSYGIQHPDGTLLHLLTGIRFYGSFLRRLDTNGDGVLSPEELASGYWGGKEKALVLFQQLDANHDDQLTPAEIMATEPLTVDVIRGFLFLDQDLDGQISPKEILSNTSTSATYLGATQTLTAFDDNHDGFLSLSEFQLAPLGYGYVILRVHDKTDLDHDGVLSWQEFYNEQSPVLLGLAWEIFRRYDRDHSRKLTLDELEFRIDPNKVPRKVLFLAIDKNRDGQLTLEDLFSETEPDETDMAKQLRYGERRRYWQYWFQFADDDRNGHLTPEEYQSALARFPSAVYARFASWDQDSDGELTAAEYLAIASSPDEKLIQRNFRVIDFDGSGGLSFDEFRSYPGQLPAAQRGTTPDPVLDLFGQALLQCSEARTAADANQDGQLSAEEWVNIRFPKSLMPFQDVPFGVWDHDQNGLVSDGEAEHLLAISYGVRHRDGTWLRLPGGIRYYDSFLRPLDTNDDLVLSSDELANGYWGGKEKGQTLFEEIDADRDGRVTPLEIMQSQPFVVDALSAFLRLDTDLDGLASPAELLAYPSSGATALGIAQTLAAFDADRDGWLSYSEYQLAPLGYGYVTLRVHGKSDQDYDGALSWQEFYTENSPVLLGLAWELFQRYDLDHNELLTLDELEFRIDANKVPTDALFLARDKNRNGQLTLDELFLDRVPGETDSAGRLRYAERERYWRQWLAAADADHSRGLSLAEYQQGRSRFPEQNYARFVAWDKNSDGKLTFKEYLAGAQPKDEVIPRRNFRLVDFDDSRDLSFEEFCAFPGLLPDRQRGTIPDPVQDLYSRAIQQWESLRSGADANQDGELSAAEWRTIEFPAALAPFQVLAFSQWDQDGNGVISSEEANHLLGVSYGMRHPDGTLLRLPAGIRLYGSFLRPLDTNGDLVWSAEELANGYWGGKEKGLALFAELDADRDGQLTATEIMATQPLIVDVLKGFQYVDKDLDGRISLEELLNHKSSGAGPVGLSQTMAAFDDNRDGFLSLPEFELAPAGYGYVTLRVHSKVDQDHDGALSWQEFYSDQPPMLMGLSWELFQRYDLNHDDKLSLDEFEFRIDPAKVPLETLFVARDINKNQQLEKEEYQAAWGTTPAALRNFSLVDVNRDDVLSREEFQALPSVPAEQRGNIPDPMIELAARALQSWKEVTQFDSSSGERGVTSRNWPGSRLKEQLGPVGELRFPVWDANRDGYVDLQEAETLLAVAYGLQQPDGTPLRKSSGHVLFGAYLRRIDKNQDGVITPDEFIPQYWEKPQKATLLYQQLDEDHDRRLSSADFWKTPKISIDTYQAFISLDQDFNGRVSRQELLASKSSGATEPRIEQMFAAFDDNHDGQLSLSEYRLLPFGMGYITYDVWGRQDLDNNGYLSWTEFFPDQQPSLMGWAWEQFRRLDQDLDGRLGYDEFEYRVNPAKVPVELEFRILDRNRDQKLEFTEIFKDPRPTSGNQADLHRYQVRMTRAEDKFLYDDRDHNGSLNLEEFTQARQAVIEAAERHRRATGRLAAVETSNWFLPAFLVVDAIALTGAGWFVLRRRSA